MRFLTHLASFLAASVVMASPISQPEPANAAVSARSGPLCQVGVPCWMQKTLDDAYASICLIADDIEQPVDVVVNGLTVQANAIASAAVYVKDALAGLTVSQATQLSAAVVAAITPVVIQIRASVDSIISTTTDVSGKVTAAANACLTGILAIEAQVGPCTNPNLPG